MTGFSRSTLFAAGRGLEAAAMVDLSGAAAAGVVEERLHAANAAIVRIVKTQAGDQILTKCMRFVLLAFGIGQGSISYALNLRILLPANNVSPPLPCPRSPIAQKSAGRALEFVVVWPIFAHSQRTLRSISGGFRIK
jgi:hypothetical protein